VENAITRLEGKLLELFQCIENDLDISRTALIPLARRGVGVLPRIDAEKSKVSSLIRILAKFGYYEKYALFPLLEELKKYDNILIFDDVCESGATLLNYEEYLTDLANKFGVNLDGKNIRFAAYVRKRSIGAILKHLLSFLSLRRRIHCACSFHGHDYEEEIFNLYMVIASRGAILDSDHMFIKANFSEKKDFFDVWDQFEEIAKSSYCDLVEDGIEFLHPERKKLGLYVKNDAMKTLKDLGMTFPDFITGIDIAKFRIVFNIEFEEKNGRKAVSTTGFEATPIVNPIIKNFSVSSCLSSWCPSFRFCENGILSREFCCHDYSPQLKYLSDNYYHPRYDCIIGNLTKQFNSYICEEIKGQFKNITFSKMEWLHQERVINLGGKLQYL
jgi:hypothetical protein